MGSLSQALQELETWPGASEVSREGLDRRLRHRQRTQRAAIAVLALAVAAGGVALAAVALGTGSKPGAMKLSPGTVHALRPAWTASVGPVSSAPAIGGHDVVVGTNRGEVLAFDPSCRPADGRCAPTWFVPGGASSIPVHVTAADGLVFASGQGLAVYEEACASHGRACSPLWTTGPSFEGHAFGPATVADGVVYVGTPDGQLLAFDEHCGRGGATCHPVWIGETGSNVDLSAPAVSDGLVYVVGNRLYAFPVGCAHGGAACAPRWSAAIGAPSFNAPAVEGGMVVVTSDRVIAFASRCRPAAGSCDPAWTYRPADGGPLAAPTVDGSTVYAAGSRLYALPLSCERACRPVWVGPDSGGVQLSAPVVSGGVVFVSGDRVLAFDASCTSSGNGCGPLWTSAALGPHASAPAVTAEGLFVTSSEGTLHAFSLTGRAPESP